MPTLHLRRPVLQWGNGYGIRLTKDEVARLRASPKSMLDVDVRTESTRLDPSQLRLLRLGRDASAKHNEIAEEEADAGA